MPVIFRCANYDQCSNEKKWNPDDFINTKIDAEKIRIMLCNECYNKFQEGPKAYWIKLKNTVNSHFFPE